MGRQDQQQGFWRPPLQPGLVKLSVMADDKKKQTFLEKLLFYTTAFFILLGIFSLFAFLFLVPFVIDPAFTTIFMKFDIRPAQCITIDVESRKGDESKHKLMLLESSTISFGVACARSTWILFICVYVYMCISVLPAFIILKECKWFIYSYVITLKAMNQSDHMTKLYIYSFM